ncbi:diacylglycerol/lipid kinase family protein [Clostridium sp. DL1XJH146]
MKHLFIINPKAGNGASTKLIPEIEKIFENIEDEYLIKLTKKPGHATDLVNDYVSKDDYRVYSVGGDGTLNEVMNGLLGSNSELAIIPCGSGNDYARSYLDFDNKNIVNILREAIDGSSKKVDTAKINDKSFINISSVGFDAEVVNNAITIKKIKFIPNHLSYLISVFVTLLKYKSIKILLEIDGNATEHHITLLAIANGIYYGGGMKVAPTANIMDGQLEICHVKHTPNIKIPFIFPKLVKGIHNELKEVSFYKTNNIKISSAQDMTVNIDGELVKLKELIIEIVPNSINLVFPA